MEDEAIDSGPRFKKGTLVRLRSGGPAMTVLGASGHKTFVVCCWFWRGKFYTEEFYSFALTGDLNAPIPSLVDEIADAAKSAGVKHVSGAENRADANPGPAG